VACDAIARLYDVDEDSVVFEKHQKTKRYDQGTVTFGARKGKLIDLDKLHESIWATRLSGGTRSGIVALEVTAIGRVVSSQHETVLQVAGCDVGFLLSPHPDAKYAHTFAKLNKVSGEKVIKLNGEIDNYRGRWPNVLRAKPQRPRRILVTGHELLLSP